MPSVNVPSTSPSDIEKALRRLKRIMNKEGILREVKDREHFISNGQRKKLAKAAAKKRASKSK